MINKPLHSLNSSSVMRGINDINPHKTGILAYAYQGYNFLVSLLAIPFRLSNYKNFGERTFGTLAFFISMLSHFIFSIALGVTIGWTLLYSYYPSSGEFPKWLFITSIIFSFINFSTIHYLRIFRQGKNFLLSKPDYSNNNYRHSYYRGDLISGNYADYFGKKKWLFKGNKESHVRMIFKPLDIMKLFIKILLITSLLGILVFYFNKTIFYFLTIPFTTLVTLSLSILFSSLFAVLDEYGIYSRTKGAILDSLDAEHDLIYIMDKRIQMLESSNISKKVLERKSEEIEFPIVKISNE